MGISSSSLSELKDNTYLKQFVGKDSISYNDPFWNQLLSFSFTPPRTCTDYRLLEENTQTLLKSLLTNNFQTGNFGSLVRVFISRAAELKASAQCENNIFTWQTYNALFILRCICKYFIETITEDNIVKQFQANSLIDEQIDSTEKENLIESFQNVLVEMIVDVPVVDFTYTVHLEAINALLILLSVQMFSSKPADKSVIYRGMMQGKCSIHACLLTKILLQHYTKQEKSPIKMHKSNKGGSIILGLASGLWSVMTLGYGKNNSDPEDPKDETPLANQSLQLILILTNHCTDTKGIHNPYRQALFSFSNSHEDAGVNPTQAVATFKLDYSQFFSTLCQTLHSDQATLLLYLVLHRNLHMKTYILSKTNIDQLIIPILRILYSAQEKNSHHIYMALIILLILSEDELFNKSIHDSMLKNVTWYTERAISEISLGGLLILVVIRTIQFNMTRMRDKYLHTNCLAALANMSSQFSSLHPYVTQRIVSLFESLAKKHARVVEQIKSTSNPKDLDDETLASDLMQDLAVLEEVLRMVLEIINSCLSSQLAHNPNLIYTLLYKRECFEQFRTHPTFQDVIQNIDSVLVYFSNRLEASDKDLSVQEVLAIIQQGALQWSGDRLKKLPDLKFKYVEEEQPEEFFIPYVWSLIFQSSNLYWNSSNIRLFTPQKLEV